MEAPVRVVSPLAGAFTCAAYPTCVLACLPAAPSLRSPYGMIYYDQDIMNIASYDWPHRFYKLHRKYNWRWKLGRDFQPSAWGAEPGICVEHFSNGDFGVDVGTGRAALFEYWRDYRRIAPGTAKRLDRGPGTPKVPWNWAIGSGMSLGPKTPRK